MGEVNFCLNEAEKPELCPSASRTKFMYDYFVIFWDSSASLISRVATAVCLKTKIIALRIEYSDLNLDTYPNTLFSSLGF